MTVEECHVAVRNTEILLIKSPNERLAEGRAKGSGPLSKSYAYESCNVLGKLFSLSFLARRNKITIFFLT